MEGNSETGKKGFVISSEYTANIDLMHAFDSVVTRTKGASKLAAEGDPRYNPMVYVWLSRMNYSDSGLWEYTPLDSPVEVKRKMNAIRDRYEVVDVVHKNTRLDDWEIEENKSTLTWKWGERKFPAGSTKTVTNPDGTQLTYVLLNEETVKYLEPDQDIDTLTKRRLDEQQRQKRLVLGNRAWGFCLCHVSFGSFGSSRIRDAR